MESPLRASPWVAPSGATGVILAIDYGQNRLGLALSDEYGVTSRPFGTWTRINRRRDLAHLRELARKQGVRRIVVGLPLHLDGGQSEMSKEVRAFGKRVEKALGIRVEMMDERLSSWEAQALATISRRAPRGGQNRKSRTRTRHPPSTGAQAGDKIRLDDVAAAIILRDYLDRVRSQTGLRD